MINDVDNHAIIELNNEQYYAMRLDVGDIILCKKEGFNHEWFNDNPYVDTHVDKDYTLRIESISVEEKERAKA